MRPLRLRPLSGTAFLLLAATIVAGIGAGNEVHADPVPHLRLVSTAPAADTVVAESPAEIRLFFSEAPQMRGTTVRLADAAEALVASSEVAADGEDPRQLFIRPSEPLGSGLYTVHWRVIAQDGHTQRGTFEFRVGGQ
jgi:methionine-rich copper-binding protein CopC